MPIKSGHSLPLRLPSLSTAGCRYFIWAVIESIQHQGVILRKALTVDQQFMKIRTERVAKGLPPVPSAFQGIPGIVDRGSCGA